MVEDRPVIAHVLHQMCLAGAEVLAADLARRLRDRFDFVFFCLDEVGPLGQTLQSEGFEVIDLGRRPGVDWQVAAGLRKHARRCGVTLLHAHQYTPFFYAAVSRRLLRRPRILFTEHGRHYPDQRKAKRIVANRWLLGHQDQVTAVGQFVQQALVDNEGIASDRIKVIYNGIDHSKFRADESDARAAVRADLGVQPNQLVVAHVARFHPVKDHCTGIRAFAVAAAAVPNAVLWLVGEGSERPAIEALIKQLGPLPVRWLGVRQDVARLLTGADVFMLSSVSEGISVTLLEAMAGQLPIATTDVGGNAEVITHGHNGLLSPRGDDKTLGSNLLALLKDASLRRRMGLAGRTRVLERFTQKQMHDQYTAVYEQLLG